MTTEIARVLASHQHAQPAYRDARLHCTCGFEGAPPMRPSLPEHQAERVAAVLGGHGAREPFDDGPFFNTPAP